MRPTLPLAALLAFTACKGEPAPPATEAIAPPVAERAPALPRTGPGCWSRADCARACLADTPHACATLADYQRLSLGAPAPDEPAAPLDRACDEGDAEACVRLALALADGDPLRTAARERARAAVDAACASGDGDGCLWGSSLAPDADNAAHVARFVKACDLGSSDGCHRVLTYALGVALTHEASLLPDGAEARAQSTLARSCAGDDAMACFSLGLHGGASERAVALADGIFDARCAAGHPPSCALLGSLRRDLRDDPEGALAAYRRACDAGLAEACGYVTPPDPRLSGAFAVTRHVVFTECAGAPEDSRVPMERFRLEPSAPPAAPTLRVLGCGSDDDDACDALFTLGARDGAGWKPGHDAVLSGEPCVAATLTRHRVRATDDGAEIVVETWISPDGDHPELCARARAGETQGLLCKAREIVSGARAR